MVIVRRLRSSCTRSLRRLIKIMTDAITALTEEEKSLYKAYFAEHPNTYTWVIEKFSPKLLREFIVDTKGFGKKISNSLPEQLSYRELDRDWKQALGNCGIGYFYVQYMDEGHFNRSILHCALLRKAYILISTNYNEEMRLETSEATLKGYGFEVLIPWTRNPNSGSSIQLYKYTIPQ